jgi:methyl-accepting chemotaxis protein
MSLAVMTLIFIKYVFALDIISQIFLIIITLIFFLGLFVSYKQQALLYNENKAFISNAEKESIGEKIINEVNNQSVDTNLNTPKEYVKIYESKSGRYLNMLVSLSNILITSGFLGTVFGLIIAMSGLRGAMATSGSGNAATLLNEMNNILSGVDTAFYTTLFGAFGGGISLRINLILHNDLLSKLVSQMRSKLIGIQSRRRKRDYNQEYKDFLSKQETFLSSLAIINSNVNIMNNNVKKLSETFAYLSKNLNAASSEISNTAEHAVVKVDALSDTLKHFFKDIYRLHKSVEKINPIFSNKSNATISGIKKTSK